MSADSKANAKLVLKQKKYIAHQQLTWLLFKAKVPKKKKDAHDAAYSMVGVIVGWTPIIDKVGSDYGGGNYGRTRYRVRVRDVTFAAAFDPASSWRDARLVTDLTKAHEQGHFDIAEITARKANDEEIVASILAKFEEIGPDQTKAVKALGDRLIALCNEYTKLALTSQNEYDRVTDHGRESHAQQALSEEHEAELAKLPSYW